MLTKKDFRVGQVVYFGRAHGEKTKGEIVKLNPTRAQVKTLEARGYGKGSVVGTVWNVPYGSMTLADEDGNAKPQELEYNPFSEDNDILELIVGVYSNLSPENLTCDGELPFARVRQRRANLERRLKGLQYALGYQVPEEQAFAWSHSKQEYETKQEVSGRWPS